jgi:uncharacterized protein involved in outer membrane biogenesis
MMKKAIVTVSVVIVLIAAGIMLTLANLDSIVAKVIEKKGTEVTGTAVSVSGVSISLKEGRGTIRGLTVASPQGYDIGDALTLDDITLDLDIQSLRGEPVVIEEVRIMAPVIRAEVRDDGSSNLDELRKNIQASAGPSAGGDKEGGDGSKRIRIKKFVFAEGKIDLDATALGMERKTLALPEIRLDDIGGKDGASPEELTRTILGSLVRNAISEVAESGIKSSLEKKLGDEARDLLNKIGG